MEKKKKIKRRVLFKINVKDKYVPTYFWTTDRYGDVPRGLKEDFEKIVSLVNSEVIFLKVERSVEEVEEEDKEEL